MIDYVVLSGLLIGLALGAVGQRSRFCLRAALASSFEGGDRHQLRAYLLAAAVAVLGTQALAHAGLVDLGGVMYTQAGVALPGLILGALLFGAGMILGGGCPNRLLVRSAEGQGGALLTWLAMTLTIMASFEGQLAGLRTTAGAWAGSLPFATLPEALGLSGWLVALLLALGVLAYLLSAPRDSSWWGWRWPATGLAVGGLAVAAWYASVASADPFDPVRPTSLTFIVPAQDLLRYLTMERLGFSLTFGAACLAGVALGAFAAALVSREFRWRVPAGRQMLRQLLGGLMMGWGGILALGCSFGQGITGLSTLSLSSAVAVGCFAVGAWLAHRLLALWPRALSAPQPSRAQRRPDLLS